MADFGEELLRTGIGSDLTIKCEGREFKVHKAVVSIRSRVLTQACRNGFLESRTGVVEHIQYDADTVERMIKYIYTADYQLPTLPTIQVPNHMPGSNGAPDETAIIGTNAKLFIHARLYAIANYYDIPALRDLALRRFRALTQPLILEGFIYVVREVNEIVPKDENGLWGVTRDIFLGNITKLASDRFFVTAITSFSSVQEFAALLVPQLAQKQEKQEREFERKLERKDAEIRRIKGHHDKNATHTKDVLETLIRVVGRLRGGCPQGCGNSDGFCRVRRKPHPTFGKGEGFVEVKCASCKAVISK